MGLYFDDFGVRVIRHTRVEELEDIYFFTKRFAQESHFHTTDGAAPLGACLQHWTPRIDELESYMLHALKVIRPGQTLEQDRMWVMKRALLDEQTLPSGALAVLWSALMIRPHCRRNEVCRGNDFMYENAMWFIEKWRGRPHDAVPIFKEGLTVFESIYKSRLPFHELKAVG